MRFWIIILLFITSSCGVSNYSGVEIEVKAKCISINGSESTFETENTNYGEIIVSGKSSSYKVGNTYILVLRKK